LYGAGKAAEAAGNAAVAQRYYQELLDVGVSNERPEIEAARKKVQVAAKSDRSLAPGGTRDPKRATSRVPPCMARREKDERPNQQTFVRADQPPPGGSAW